MLRALLYAYVLGGVTFIPLVVVAFFFVTIYTSVPVGDVDVAKRKRGQLEAASVEDAEEHPTPIDTNDAPRTRKGWLTMRRTFEETVSDSSYVTLVRSFLDSHSKDPKRSRPKDMWYVVLKGNVLYLYENEEMSECEAVVELSSHQVVIYPEDLPDGELFAKRNAICLKPKTSLDGMPSVTKQMQLGKGDDIEEKLDVAGTKREAQRNALLEAEKAKDAAMEEALDPSIPWFIFVRSNIEMEDWYFSLIHASDHPAQTPTLSPLSNIFDAADMNHLVKTLDEQPDVIPMRWLNALLGRIFFSHYRTHNLEAYIIGRLMKKLSKVKRPAFLTEIAVTQVSVGNKVPMLSKPMLKELTKEGDSSIEVHLQYKGEVRITVEATAVINLGARFKSYTVKLTLAVVLRELEGNLLIKVKRPPSNRIWYAFTQTPRMVMDVEPIVSDRQITWGMILSTIESKIKEIVQESVVMPNMDDIAFFETGLYQHRGGIWSDACRKLHVSTPSPPVPDDVQSVASAPLPEKSQLSSGDLTNEDSSTNNAAPGADTSPSVVEVVEDTPNLSRNNTRRRSWFTGVRNGDLVATDFFLESQPSDSEGNRGRTGEPEMSSSPRSRSAPKPESLHVPEPEKEGSEGSQFSTHLRPSISRRSSSHSSKLEREPQEEEATAPRTKSTPTTPRKNSDASQIARSPSPPSFFSTLKTKAAAADKQAISNTAKEAMRKWGVNWGGFKKDANNPTQPNEESSQSGGSPSRSSSLFAEGSALAQRARTSYAEVRAAVAERKERDRTTSQVEDNSDSSLLQSHPPPVRARVVSNPRTALPNQSVYSETPINPSIVTSAARLATPPKLNSKKSTPSMSRVNTEVDTDDLPTSEHAPIHVQPQAKTMSIPGIHASHRGEVQSLGYVAPQPPAPSETMLKNPAIQTVYRLWKNPSAPGQEPTLRAQPSLEQLQAGKQGSSESVEPTLSTDDAGSVLSPAPKPTPPPLPPRSTSTGTHSVSTAPRDSPSASQTLKTIAQKDETSRSQAAIESPPTVNHTLPQQEPADATTGSTEEPQVIRGLDNDTSSSITHSELEATPCKLPPTLPPRRITTPA